MIKYIKIHGLKALNKDIEITFRDFDKYVLIIGPNGSGKTTLLKHITNPMANASGLNMVRDGYNEAYKEIILEYKGNTYKIRHIFRRGKTLSTNSYIAKLVNGEYIELCENGLVTNFKDIVARELEFYDHYNDLLNIGITNHGIVTMTDSNKLEYIKKIYNNKELDTMRDNTSKHYSFLNNKLKIIKDKLSKYDLLKTYEDELTGIKSKKASSLSNLNKTRALLNELLTKYSKDAHDRLQKERDVTHTLYKQAKHIRDYTQFKESVTDYLSNLDKELSELNTKLDISKNNIISYDKEMKKFLDINKNSERREVLEKEYKKLNIDCPEYKLDIEDINECRIVINDLLNARYTIEGITFNKIYNALTQTYDYHNKQVEKITKALSDTEETLKKLELDNEDIKFDIIASLTPKDGCTENKCGLLIEYRKQKANKETYIKRNNEMKKLKIEIDNLKDELWNSKMDRNIHQSLYLEEDICLKVVGIPYLEIIKMGTPEDILEKLKSIEIKLKDKLKLNDIMKELHMLKEIEESVAKDRISDLDEKMSEEIEAKKEYLVNIDIIENSIKSYSRMTVFDKNLLSYNKEKIKEVVIEYKNLIDTLDKKLEGYTNNAQNFEVFEGAIKAEEDNIEDLNNRIKEIEFKILAVKELEKEAKETSGDLQIMSTLRQIVNKILPSRVLGNLINDIENDVNRLLDGFMRIEFDKTDNGLRIICNLSKGNDNLSNDLSQGEKSMLSIALLFAIKKYLPWGIVSIDEGSAAFDTHNKSRFIDMIESYSNTIDNLNQIFIVSHDHMFDEISKVIDLS